MKKEPLQQSAKPEEKLKTLMMIKSFIISEKEAALRLDKMLSLYFPEHSRSYFQYLIEKGHVLINGKSLKKKEKANLGDEIQVHFQQVPDLSVKSQDIPLDIIYEDEALIVINKPAGMVVHPAPGNPSNTFANALLFHCKNLSKENFDLTRPGIVHRLDKDTSGILMAAKTYEAHQKLVAQFSQRKVKKTYLAICIGSLQPGIISAPIKRHPTRRKQMAILSEGKEAITHVKVLKKKEPFSLIEAELITGRTHQIRVHLKYKNAPVLGDALYGSVTMNRKYGISRQFLHASYLKLTHPLLNKILEFKAPLPNDMQVFIEKYF